MKILPIIFSLVFALCYSSVAQQPTINLIENSINGYKKENLGPQVNSPQNELLPIISASGKLLYFARYDQAYRKRTGRINEDIWFSKKLPTQKWSTALDIGRPLNNRGSNAVISVTADENTLFLANTYDDAGLYAGPGISVTKRGRGGWSMPEKVKIEGFYNKSRVGGQTFCFSTGRRALIMSVEQDDSKGSVDLYVSFIQEDGTYGTPINMGTTLNSVGVDYAPFIAADNHTLYFASDGHPGYGDSDIFISRRLDDTWTNWSEPQNLGPEVNSESSDAFYTVPASGDFAYMVSKNRDGDSDIYRVRVPESARPQPTVLVYGKTFTLENRSPMAAEILYYDLDTGKELGLANSNPEDGSYKIYLPLGRQYGLQADQVGFYATTRIVDLSIANGQWEIARNLFLRPNPKETELTSVSGSRVGQPGLYMGELLFDTGKSDLHETAKKVLNTLVRMLENNPEVRIEVQGHTDDIGGEDTNLALSEARARAVVVYLLESGIPGERLSSRGFGEELPISPNTTPDGRAQNRRVEIVMIE